MPTGSQGIAIVIDMHWSVHKKVRSRSGQTLMGRATESSASEHRILLRAPGASYTNELHILKLSAAMYKQFFDVFINIYHQILKGDRIAHCRQLLLFYRLGNTKNGDQMKAYTITPKGQVTIPAEIRKKLNRRRSPTYIGHPVLRFSTVISCRMPCQYMLPKILILQMPL